MARAFFLYWGSEMRYTLITGVFVAGYSTSRSLDTRVKTHQIHQMSVAAMHKAAKWALTAKFVISRLLMWRLSYVNIVNLRDMQRACLT